MNIFELIHKLRVLDNNNSEDNVESINMDVGDSFNIFRFSINLGNVKLNESILKKLNVPDYEIHKGHLIVRTNKEGKILTKQK